MTVNIVFCFSFSKKRFHRPRWLEIYKNKAAVKCSVCVLGDFTTGWFPRSTCFKHFLKSWTGERTENVDDPAPAVQFAGRHESRLSVVKHQQSGFCRNLDAQTNNSDPKRSSKFLFLLMFFFFKVEIKANEQLTAPLTTFKLLFNRNKFKFKVILEFHYFESWNKRFHFFSQSIFNDYFFPLWVSVFSNLLLNRDVKSFMFHL